MPAEMAFYCGKAKVFGFESCLQSKLGNKGPAEGDNKLPPVMWSNGSHSRGTRIDSEGEI